MRNNSSHMGVVCGNSNCTEPTKRTTGKLTIPGSDAIYYTYECDNESCEIRKRVLENARQKL